ncbi:TrmH family RNA methyltransferase, partial [Kaarinaea lacus]
MVSRQESKRRARRHKEALLRYQKERFKNQAAEPGEHEFIIVLDHLKAGFNVPKIFRSAEAFGAHEIHLINVGPFDPAPAKGAFRKVPARFHDSFASCYQQLRDRGYTFFALQADCETPLYDTKLTGRSAFIMGNEGLGISFDPQKYPDIRCLSIPHVGQTES